MPGLSNESRSFFFKFLHNILPTQDRLNRITRNVNSDVCVCCDDGTPDNAWSHSFTKCAHTAPVMDWLKSTLVTVDPAITVENIIWLQINAISESYEIAALWLIAETMSFAWAQRKTRTDISIPALITNLNTKATFLLNSQHHHNSGSIILELIGPSP